MKFKKIIEWVVAMQYRYKYDEGDILFIYPTDASTIRVKHASSKVRVTFLPYIETEHRTQKEALLTIMKAIDKEKEYAMLEGKAKESRFHRELLSLTDRANATVTYTHTLMALQKNIACVNIKNGECEINVKYNFTKGGAIIGTGTALEDEVSVIAQLEKYLL